MNSDYFTQGLDGGAGIDAAGAAHVSVNRNSPLGGQTEGINDFPAGGSGGVLDAHADRQAASVEFGAQAIFDPRELFWCRGLVG
ncbi:MAG: hypothetical protein WBQ43_23945, partial [Terriglobales bacterium]